MRRAALGTALALVLTACIDRGGTDTTAPESTTPATAAPAATAPPGACSGGDGALPAPASGVTVAIGDFDGDGLGDEFRVYEASPGVWHARVDLAYGYAADVVIEDAFGVSPYPVGAFDVDVDGQDETFLVVGSGAAAVENLGLYTFAGCNLSRVITQPGGDAAVFPVGISGAGSILTGLKCFPGDSSGDLAVYTATSTDLTTYDWQTDRFELIGRELVLVDVETATLTSPSPESARAAGFTCGELSLAAPPETTTLPALPIVVGPRGLGIVEFGDDADDVVDRLNGFLGTPDTDTGWIEEELCRGRVRFVRWSSLEISFTDGETFWSEEGRRHFAAYLHSLDFTAEPLELRTAEGIGIGASVEELLAVYGPQLQITDETIYELPIFIISREGDLYEIVHGRLVWEEDAMILWGMLSGTDPFDTVRSIRAGVELCEI